MKVSVVRLSLPILAAVAYAAMPCQSSQATLLYGVDNAGSIWQVDTTGNSGAGSYSKLTLGGTSYGTSVSFRGMAIDGSGTLYSTSNSTGKVYSYSISGSTATVSNLATSWTGTSDIVTDGNYLYITAGQVVNRIQISTGTITEKIGGDNWGQNLRGIGLGANGTVYFVGGNGSNDYIYSIANAATASGNNTNTTPWSTAATYQTLRDVFVVDSNVYVDTNTKSVLNGSTMTTYFSTGTLSPYYTIYDSVTGHLFMSTTASDSTCKIVEYTTDGTVVASYNTPNVGWQGIAVVAAPVPEAASLAMIAAGAGALLLRRRKA